MKTLTRCFQDLTLDVESGLVFVKSGRASLSSSNRFCTFLIFRFPPLAYLGRLDVQKDSLSSERKEAIVETELGFGMVMVMQKNKRVKLFSMKEVLHNVSK